MTRLIYDGTYFIFRCGYADREIPKANGFRWSTDLKVWYTSDLSVAAKLRDYAVDEAKTKLGEVFLQKTPWSLPLPALPDGLTLLPHQALAIRFALERNRCYLGLDPGLGKTICAAVIASALKRSVVYVTPPFLVGNVKAEFEKWAPEVDLRIIRDSMLTSEPTKSTRKEIEDFIQEVPHVLFVDEAHRFKNAEAKRTQALFGHKRKAAAPITGLASYFKRQVYLSGTPMPNRPIELYPVLSAIAPETIGFMNQFEFGRRYCAGHKSQWGWDFSGASNMAELRDRVIHPLGPFMLRMKKDLLDLPPKTEELFVVSEGMSPALAKMDKLIGWEDLMKEQIAEEQEDPKEYLHLMTYRRLLGQEKARLAVPYLKSLLEETEENILVFAYHKDVIAYLEEELGEWQPIVITGETPVDRRQNMVKEFQEQGTKRLIIGNYLAMGVGFTVTKATRVVFIEFDWVPGVNDQAADRTHRIGQKNSVLVQYVVYKDSVDKVVIETLLRKRKALQYV